MIESSFEDVFKWPAIAVTYKASSELLAIIIFVEGALLQKWSIL
jgi:hypothetical protein